MAGRRGTETGDHRGTAMEDHREIETGDHKETEMAGRRETVTIEMVKTAEAVREIVLNKKSIS